MSAVIVLLLVVACAPRRIVLETPDGNSVSQPATFDWSDYAWTLRRCVVNGSVDYAVLCGDHRGLDRTLAAMARAGPASTPSLFPDHSARLAYWINAYNALILRGVIEQIPSRATQGRMVSIPASLPRDPETAFLLTLDGRDRSAADVRRIITNLAGDDWRVDFVLCDGHVGGPPLFDQPFLAELLDAQLDEALGRALESPHVVWLDHGGQFLCVWRGLAELRGRLVADFRRRTGIAEAGLLNVLLERASTTRRLVLNSAIGYGDCTLPFDERVNHVMHVNAAR